MYTKSIIAALLASYAVSANAANCFVGNRKVWQLLTVGYVVFANTGNSVSAILVRLRTEVLWLAVPGRMQTWWVLHFFCRHYFHGHWTQLANLDFYR